LKKEIRYLVLAVSERLLSAASSAEIVPRCVGGLPRASAKLR